VERPQGDYEVVVQRSLDILADVLAKNVDTAFLHRVLDLPEGRR
jgi:hypothetical protein